MVQRADWAIVNLTPVRGPSADAGTVFELGPLTGFGTPCFGYNNDAEDLLRRTLACKDAVLDPATRIWRDGDGLSIEDFGNADNLRTPVLPTGERSSSDCHLRRRSGSAIFEGFGIVLPSSRPPRYRAFSGPIY
jgi:nucleoside 2-deoxyribosyltransferase